MHTETGLRIEIIEQGSGRTPQPGESVTVHYTGMLTDGRVFVSTHDGAPLTYVHDRAQVLPGWDEGIGYLNEGSKARLTLPPELAYGKRGAKHVIPPDATVIFEVELVKVSDS